MLYDFETSINYLEFPLRIHGFPEYRIRDSNITISNIIYFKSEEDRSRRRERGRGQPYWIMGREGNMLFV